MSEIYIPTDSPTDVRVNRPPKKKWSSSDRVTIGCLALDFDAFEATSNGVSVELSASENELLCLLASSPGVVKSRAELAQYVGIGERTVDLLISNLRRKFEFDFIRTVRGRGWSLQVRLLEQLAHRQKAAKADEVAYLGS